MEVRLLNFHCVINFNDFLLGCGTYAINDKCIIQHDLLNSIYIALINPEVQDVNKQNSL